MLIFELKVVFKKF